MSIVLAPRNRAHQPVKTSSDVKGCRQSSSSIHCSYELSVHDAVNVTMANEDVMIFLLSHHFDKSVLRMISI